jgi:hypothetical protein
VALAYLLDENITHVVAREIHLKRPDIQVTSVFLWREGAFRGKPDIRLLRAAAEDELTLVTYDQKTIPPLLYEWGTSGENHAGVLFVDEKTIAQRDIGGLVTAIIESWDRTLDWEWRNTVDFLRPAPNAK